MTAQSFKAKWNIFSSKHYRMWGICSISLILMLSSCGDYRVVIEREPDPTAHLTGQQVYRQWIRAIRATNPNRAWEHVHPLVAPDRTDVFFQAQKDVQVVRGNSPILEISLGDTLRIDETATTAQVESVWEGSERYCSTTEMTRLNGAWKITGWQFAPC